MTTAATTSPTPNAGAAANLRNYVLVTAAYWADTLTDGAIRMLVLFYFFELGYSPIWFGIFLVRTMEIGFVHPPLGLNVYVIQGIAKDIPLGAIFRA